MSKRKISPAVIADNFIQQMELSGTPLATVRGETLRFNGRCFQPFELIHRSIAEYSSQKFGLDVATGQNVDEVVKTIRYRTQIHDGWRPYWKVVPNKVASTLVLRNGVLVFLRDGNHRFVPHTPSLIATAYADFDFDPSVGTCPQYESFLRWFVQDDPYSFDFIIQTIAQPLLRFLDFQQCVILVGESGQNGKSVQLNTTKNLLGDGNVSGVSMDRLGGRFSLSPLRDMTLNIDADLNETSKIAEGTLKKLIDHSPLIFEAKYQALVTSASYCSQLFSCNLTPNFRANDGGSRRRLIFFPCNARIDDCDKVQNLEATFNYSGILNMVLEMMPRLVEQGGFTIPSVAENFGSRYWIQNNSAQHFLNDQVCVQPGNKLEKQTLYNWYREWCDGNGNKAFSKANFGKQVAACFREPIADGLVSLNGKTASSAGSARRNCFVGLEYWSCGVDNQPQPEPVIEQPRPPAVQSQLSGGF